MNRLIGIILILLVIFQARITCAQEAVVLTLDEAIAIALRDNRDIQLSEEELARAKAKIKEAKGAFFPEVTLGGGALRSRGLYAKNATSYSFSAGIKEHLYKGGKSVNTLKQAKYNQKSQEFAVDEEVNKITLDVQKAFYAILLAEEFLAVNKKIFENKNEHFKSILAREQKGELSESDLLRVKAGLASLRSLLEKSKNDRDIALFLFKNILHLDEGVKVTIKGELEYAPKDVAIDQAVLKALADRPEIKKYEAKIGASKAAVEIAKSAARPSIYGSWDYESDSRLRLGTIKKWNDSNSIGITFSWPIFDGLVTRAKVEGALSDLKTAQITRQKSEKDIILETQEAYLELKSNINKLNSVEEDIIVYRDNFKTAQARYKEGNLSNLDLDDAGLALEIAFFNQQDIVYNCLLAKAKLDKAMGAQK